MKKITLESYEKFSLSEDKVFVLKKGKVITKSIAPSGKIISNNTCLKKGGILFNWFNFCNKEDNLELEIEVDFKQILVSRFQCIKYLKHCHSTSGITFVFSNSTSKELPIFKVISL